MGFFGYSEATNPCERAVTKMIKLPNISEDTRVLLGQIQKEIKLNPDAYTMGILVDLPRTVNGTGHTGPSEFCATSI